MCYHISIPGEEWSGKVSSVNPKGICRNCGEQLAREDLSSDQFEQLRESFLQKCVQREDVFLNTSPKELKIFQDFLSNQKPFDFVLDGLNISLRMSKKKRQRGPITVCEAYMFTSISMTTTPIIHVYFPFV